MKEIPLKAKVQCSDTSCGKSTNVILNPDTHQVTYVAIKDKTLPDNPTRMVPIEKVEKATPEQIALNCTREEVADMEPYIVTKMIEESIPGIDHDGSMRSHAVQVNQVPDYEMSISPGMKIKASDHTVGKLDELVIDPQSGAITHVQMREGHLFGKKDVTIPVADVDWTDGETIFLTIDKKAVEALPAVPVKRK